MFTNCMIVSGAFSPLTVIPIIYFLSNYGELVYGYELFQEGDSGNQDESSPSSLPASSSTAYREVHVPKGIGMSMLKIHS